MKTRKRAILVLASGLILSLLLSPSLKAQGQEQVTKAKESKVVIIPAQVKKVFEEGMQTREVRSDIPFTVVRHLYFPAGQNFYTVILFKVKNADLGFAPLGEAPAKKKEEALSAFETEASKLQARSHLFMQFNKIENGVPGQVSQEVYVPINLQEDSSTYEPEKMEIYSAGYPLTSGQYLLSLAICSQKLEKIGTQYYEFSLLDLASLADRLETTPIFFVNNQEYMDSAERKPTLHKDSFTYSIMNIELNIDRVFALGESLGLFFYIFGAQPDENGKFNIEVSFDVLKEGEKAILFAPGQYDAPLIIQQLPLVKTVLVKSESGETTEKRNAEPGKYTLSLTITDKISGKSVNKSIDFEVR
jgi:hypothetical protein